MLTSTKFNFYRGKDFMVEVVGWESPKDKWNWNVYAYIYESHKLFGDKDKCLELPFNCGATLEDKIKTSPAWGIKYDWQKETETIKLGSDYNHIYDSYDHHPSPADGIPANIYSDAKVLAEALEKYHPSNLTKESVE